MTGGTAEPHESPLGRYDSESDAELHEVRLVGLPLRLLAAGREHHDEVMREFAVLALDERISRDDVPARMVQLIDVLGRRYGAAGARPDAEVDAALARGADTIDLVYHVPAHVIEAADQLDALMAEADEFCKSEQLLTLARPPVLIDMAAWYLGEFRRQIAGEPPQPWTGPLDL